MRALLLICIAQFPPALPAQQYHFRLLPSFNDRDIQHITVLFQASDHWMWIGTDRGLYTFDGLRYELVSRDDDALRRVTAISEHPSGQIWAGYEDGHLHACSRGYHQHDVIAHDSLAGVGITSILFDTLGEAFITTYGRGAWQIIDHRLHRVQCPALAHVSDIYDAATDAAGRLYIATDNGVWTWEKNDCESLRHINRKKGLPDEIVTHLEPGNTGIWMGLYDYGLVRYDPDPDAVISVALLPSGPGSVSGLTVGPAGEVWMGTQKALVRSGGQETHRVYTLPDDLRGRSETILADHDGNLWLSSGRNLYYANTGLEFFIPGIAGIQSIALTKDRIWLGCENGLFSFHPHSHRLERHLQHEKINILCMYTDAAGRIWIGTFGQGLYIFNPSNATFRRLTEKDGISNNSILNLDGRGNNVWLATLGGITEISWRHNPFGETLKITEFQDTYDFPPGYVYDVYAAADGHTWFGTDGMGLFLLHASGLQQVFVRMDSTLVDEAALRTIYSIAGGTGETIWISCGRGNVVKTDATGRVFGHMATGQGSLQSVIKSGSYDLLMISDGSLQVKKYSGDMIPYAGETGLDAFAPHLNAVATGRDSSVWIAGTDRILHYAATRIDARSQVVMHLDAGPDGVISTGGGVRLRPESNVIDLRFTGLWYPEPRSVRYRYRLEGHDTDWIYTREARAVYSRLAPGHYIFRVEGSHHDDFEGASRLSLAIKVLPPFYLRWWFVLGITIAGAGLFYGYIRSRIKRLNRLHELEKEKTLLQLHAIQAQVNPHFLFNSFNTLSSIIEEDQQAAVEYLDRISGFFRGVLMHRDAGLIRLEEELGIVRDYISILQKRYGANLRIREDIRHTSGWIAPLSIQLLVENAIKHNTVSAGRPLTIQITSGPHWVTVSNPVQPRLDPAPESTGFGLSSLLARYQYLTDEKIEIVREDHTFTVRIPVIEKGKQI